MKLFGSFLNSKGETERSSLSWESLEDVSGVEEITSVSFEIPVIIYKHSTRCGISSMVLNRLEREYDLEAGRVKLYFLDLIRYREVSNRVSRVFKIPHESPQLLLIKNGAVCYHASHGMISMTGIRSCID